MLTITPWHAGSEPAALRRLLARQDGPSPEVTRTVLNIIRRVRESGDVALVELAREHDGVAQDHDDLRVSRDELSELAAGLDPKTLTALEELADAIRRFHQDAPPSGRVLDDGSGGRLELKVRPLDSVGIYVPGASAAHPASALMCAIPASIAGVERLVAVSPPGALERSPALAAALQIAGVDEVYRVGGAQAIAALAFGTETIPAVTKVVGPGNIYVAAAKRLCWGRVGIDSFTGPGEVVVVADPETSPRWIAADLISQAEHDELVSAVAIVWDPEQAQAVVEEVQLQLADLPRRATAAAALRDRGAVFTVLGPDAACRLVDIIAPQMVELLLENPAPMAARIRNAGTLFLGRYTPQAVGDYAAGTNHVQPTFATARFSSGLSVADFVKRTQLVQFSAARLEAARGSAATLAREEGLEGHARSLEVRGAIDT